MNSKENETLSAHIRFPIYILYDNNSYSSDIFTLGQTQFKFIFSINKNQLKIIIERDKTNLSCYTVQIRNFLPNPDFLKFNIRFDKDKKKYELYIKEATDFIVDDIYEIGIQIQLKKFNVPSYNSSTKKESSKKQSKLGDYFQQTTEDYVGIPNQGATCYLNSLLQVLYHLKKFRKLIYDEKVENDESNFIFCLQLLFRDIQLRKYRRSTRYLTNSLGWDKEAVCTSQDVSEFYKLLFESIIKDSPRSLFEGEFNITIKDTDMQFVRSMKESFIQVLLNVEGFGNITDSFQALMFPFSFYDNENTDIRQERIKEKKFTKLPSVFTVVLKRFWFNDEKKQYEKLNSIMLFPDILDLNECGINFNDSKYQLFAIIAHIGTLNSGHYVSFINPDLKGAWYEFDDNKVYKLNKDIVFDLCYGKNRMNAYMLFYVKLSMKDELFNNSLLEIPKNIQDYKYKVVKENSIQFFMNDETGIIYNLKKFKPLVLNLNARKSFTFDVGTSFSNIYDVVASALNKDSYQIRIWNIHNDQLLNVFDKKQKLKKTDNRSWFVQVISESELQMIDEMHFVAFIIFYLPETQQKLFYLGSHQFCVNDSISMIEKVVSQKYLLKSFPMISFAFTKSKVISLSNLSSSSFADSAFTYNGLFLIVQAQPGIKISLQDFQINISNLNQVEDKNDSSDIIEFDDPNGKNFDFVDAYINHQLNQIIFHIFHISKPEKPIIKISVDKGISSSKLKELIAIYSGFDYNSEEDTILLFNKKDSKMFLDERILNIILTTGNTQTNIYFALYKGVKEIKESNQISIDINYNQKQTKFTIDKNMPIKTIHKCLIDNNIIPDNNKKLRFFFVNQSRIVSVLNENDIIVDNYKNTLHIEEIPNYQLEEDIVILKVTQCIKDGDELMFFGNPFFIGLKFLESCIQVKEKICSVINCEMQNLNILIQGDNSKTDSYRLLLDDENVLNCLDGNNELFAYFNS